MSNKVLYGLSNVHYAPVVPGEGGAVTYGTPVAWPGAVSLAMSPVGDTSPFYADNVQYFVAVNNGGYEGDYESAQVPESFLTDIMGYVKDTKGIISEYSNIQPKEFALLFQFEGDQSGTRHIFYNCKCARPNIEGKTTEDSIEVQTMTASLTASPRVKDSLVHAYTSDKDSAEYQAWFEAVKEPSATA